MAPPELQEAIVERRAAIRAHRDAKGDDRCWIDDHTLWAFVDGTPGDLSVLPGFAEGMARCREFYRHRRAEIADVAVLEPVSPGRDPDVDISLMTQAQMAKSLAALQAAIRVHADIKDRPRNLDDDRALYAALPEKIPPDFRLPPEPDFLGEAKAPRAGCPSFWRSHASCAGKHDLHRWGPCKGDT